MANRERGEIGLVAKDGTDYTLRLTTNAVCELEDRSGRLFDDIVKGVMNGRVKDMRWLIWAAMQDHHAEAVTTPQAAGDVIDACGGLAVVSAQMQAFIGLNADDSPKEEGAEPNPPRAEASRGADSTSTPDVSASPETPSGGSRSVNSGENWPPAAKRSRPREIATSASRG